MQTLNQGKLKFRSFHKGGSWKKGTQCYVIMPNCEYKYTSFPLETANVDG